MTPAPGWALTRLPTLHNAIRSDLTVLDEASRLSPTADTTPSPRP